MGGLAAAVNVFFAGAIWAAVKAVATVAYVIYLWKQRKKANQSPTYGFDIQTQSSNELTIPVVYGRVKAGGNIVWQRMSYDKSTIYAFVAFSEGPIEDFEDIRVNDIPIGDLPGCSYTPYLGTPDQVIDERCPGGVGFFEHLNYGGKVVELGPGNYTAADLAKVGLVGDIWYSGSWMSSVKVNHHKVTLYSCDYFDGDSWVLGEDTPDFTQLIPNAKDRVYSLKIEPLTNADRAKIVGGLRHVAYIAFTIKAGDKISGGMPNFTAIVKGRKVRVWENESWVTKFSENPVWHLYDLLTHTRYGGGYTDSQINIEGFKTAAAFCDEILSDGQPRFTEGIIIDWVDSLPDIVDQIRFTCRGYVVSYNGKLTFKIEQPEEPCQHFSMENIVEDSLEIYVPGKDEEWQKVTVTYCEPNQNWAKLPAQSVDETNPLNPIKKDFTIVGVNRFSQASRLAYFYRVYSKYCRFSGKFKTTIRALNRIPGDVITITDDVMGWVEKPVRILEIRHAGDHGHEIYFREYNETIYNDALGSAVSTPTYTTLPSKYVTPPDPTELALTEVTNTTNAGVRITGLKVTFLPALHMYYSYTLIEISEDSGVTWRAAGYPTTGECFIQGLDIGKTYIVRARTVNAIDLKSDGISLPITITGYDLPPAAPANLAYNWDSSDLKVWWGAVYQNNDYSATVDIKDYKVEVYVNGELKRVEESVLSNLYTYTYAKNIADNGTPENGYSPVTTVTVKVYTRDFGGNLSDAAQITGSVPAPTAPMLAANVGIAQITLIADLSNVQLQKYQKLQIKASQVDGFNPDTDGAFIHDNPATVFNHAVDTGSTWHYRARIVDMFGQMSPWSDQVSATADKLDESEFLAEVLRLETTSGITPTLGVLANLHDGTDISSATFDQATWIEDKFVGEQRFSYFRIRTQQAVNFYVQYFNEDTQAWVDCCGSAASPKTSLADQNYDVQITPIVAARRIRVQLLAAATVKEIRFCTVGQYTDLYADKIKAGMIEAGTLQIGREVQAVPTPLTINPNTDKLFHFDSSLNSTQGIQPLAGAVATLRQGEGKFGGAVAVEFATYNHCTDQSLNIYNLWADDIEITKETLSETYYGQPIQRFRIKPLTDVGRNRMRAHTWGHGCYSSQSFTFNADWAYTATIYWRCSKDSVVVDGSPANIEGWSGFLTENFGNGWKRSHATRWHSTTANDCKCWGVQDTTINTGETIIVDFVCHQVEVAWIASSFVVGSRPAGMLTYPSLNMSQKAGTFSVLLKPQNYIYSTVDYLDVIDFRSDQDEVNRLLVLRKTANSFTPNQMCIKNGDSWNEAYFTISPDVYSRITWTWSETSYAFYINDTQITSGARTPGNTSFDKFVIREAGLFDDLLILPRTATADEIKLWYETNAPFYDPAQIIEAGGGVIRGDNQGIWGYQNGVKQAGFGTDGKWMAGAGAIVADAAGFHGYDPQAGYAKTFDITARGEIKDKDGYSIIDVNGKFNGKVILSGTLPEDTASGAHYMTMNNVVIPQGKKWVLYVIPISTIDIPAATTGKSIKWLWHFIDLHFNCVNHGSIVPAGNYATLEFFINHYSEAWYSYTDSSSDNLKDVFAVYYEIREISA